MSFTKWYVIFRSASTKMLEKGVEEERVVAHFDFVVARDARSFVGQAISVKLIDGRKMVAPHSIPLYTRRPGQTQHKRARRASICFGKS